MSGRKLEDAKLGLATGITLLFWASAFVGIRAALDSYSPGHLAVFRYLIASFVLLVIALFHQIKLPQKKHIPVIMLNGLLGIAIYHSALNFGELYVSAGVASFIINAVPIFTAILAYIFLNERLRKYAWVGIIISFFGVTLIIFCRWPRLQSFIWRIARFTGGFLPKRLFCLAKTLFKNLFPS